MADLSSFTDQERALLAQYLALKAGSPANAEPLVQQVLAMLASGQHGSTLVEVLSGLLPDGIPAGTDYSEYLDYVNTGSVQQPPMAYAPSGGGGGDYSPAEAFTQPQGRMDPALAKKVLGDGYYGLFDWMDGGTGGKIDIERMFDFGSLFEPKQAAPAAATKPAAPFNEENGLFNTPMSPAIPPQGAPPPPMTIMPLFPDPPRPDPRGTAVASLTSTAPTPLPTPAPLELPTPIVPPSLPPINPLAEPAGQINLDKDQARLSSTVPELNPAAAVNPFTYVPGPDNRPGRLSDEFSPSPPRPAALATASVNTVPINPQTGTPTDFSALARAAMQRDVAGPLDYDTANRGISQMSGAARAPAAPAVATSAPGAGVTPNQRNAIAELPHPSQMITGPQDDPPLTEWVLRDWIKSGGLDRQAAPEQSQPVSFDLSAFPTPDPALQSALDAVAAQRRPMTSAPGAGVAPEQRTAMSRLPPVAPSPAPLPADLPAARRAVAAALPEHMIELTANEREMLARAVATEVDPRAARIDPSAYEKQVYRVVDTMLNREASGQFGEFNDLVSVLNQPGQFSAINGPESKKGEHYGQVQNIPAERASPELREMVESWVDKRVAGEPSSVGGALHYANPEVADASNMAWINTLNGPRDDAGPFSHWYGTTEGFTPVEAQLRNPALDAADSMARGEAWLTAGADAQRPQQQAFDGIFNRSLQSAAQQRQQSTSERQRVTSPTGRSITVGQRNAFGGYDGGGGGGGYSPGDPWTSPSQRVTSPTGKSITVGQRNAFGGYTSPSPSTSAGRRTSSSQRVTSPTGRSITVSQRNAFGGY